ncbi:MAG: hypothetical protein EA413_08415 [Cyanobium sp. PLM2.Bin73]|nr:MAG: hypothetical protein EA413_08415 [Cyanobium sp. PLM2.Bin73]
MRVSRKAQLLRLVRRQGIVYGFSLRVQPAPLLTAWGLGSMPPYHCLPFSSTWWKVLMAAKW